MSGSGVLHPDMTASIAQLRKGEIMKKGILVFATLLMASMLLLGNLPLVAQTDFPRGEVFVGYSYVSLDTGPESSRKGLNGWNAQGSVNVNRWFGLTADFGGYYGSPFNVSVHDYSFLFGPTLTYRAEHVAPFIHALVGADHVGVGTDVGSGGSLSQTKFAWAAGGGIDLPINQRFGIRLIQADFLRTQHFTDEQNNIRLSAGLLFMFGGAPPVPVSASCSASPAEVWSGEPVTVTATGANFNPKHTLTYAWTGTGGKLSSANAATATIDTAGLAPGSYTANATITDAKHNKNNVASCSASFTVKQPGPPVVSCSANPTTIAIGESATVTMTASDPQGWPLTYSWTNAGGTLSGSDTSVTMTATNTDAGNTLTVTGTATDARANLSASCTASVNVPGVTKCTTIEDWGECTFEKNPKKPWRVDNDCKDTLDKLSLRLQQMPNGKLDIVGYTDDEEVVKEQTLGAQRSVNVKYYLTTDGPNKVDASRVTPRQGGAKGQATHFYFVPEGSLCSGQMEEGTVVDETAVQPQSRMAPAPKHHKAKAKPAASQRLLQRRSGGDAELDSSR